MKIVASILSLYILVLTTIPCVDVAAINTFHNSELTQTGTDGHHSDFDRCSPFCSCDCCTSPVMQQDYIIRFSCSTILQKLIFEYSKSYISSLFTSIWQPPKIS